MYEEVKALIDRVKPYIQADGGDIELVAVEEGIVYVKMHGACVGCNLIDSTLFDGLLALLKDNLEGVISVVEV